MSKTYNFKIGDRITWTIMDNCGKCYHRREKELRADCESQIPAKLSARQF